MPYRLPGSRKLWWKPYELGKCLRMSAQCVMYFVSLGLPHERFGRQVLIPHVEARKWFIRRGLSSHAKVMRRVVLGW